MTRDEEVLAGILGRALGIAIDDAESHFKGCDALQSDAKLSKNAREYFAADAKSYQAAVVLLRKARAAGSDAWFAALTATSSASRRIPTDTD